jgi:hypothetical protein
MAEPFSLSRSSGFRRLRTQCCRGWPSSVLRDRGVEPLVKAGKFPRLGTRVYHSAKTARDRDRLRQSVLEGLGWRMARIWSTEWRINADKCLAAVETRLAESREAPAQNAAAPLPSNPPSLPSPVARAVEPATRPAVNLRPARHPVVNLRPGGVSRFPKTPQKRSWPSQGLSHLSVEHSLADLNLRTPGSAGPALPGTDRTLL